MTIVNADYVTVINDIRNRIGHGTAMDAPGMRLALQVVQDAIARFTTGNTAQEAVRTDLTTQITACGDQATAITAIFTSLLPFDTEGEITLDVPGTAAAVVAAKSALTTASTAVTAIGTALTTDKASILTGEISVPSPTTNAVADGTAS